MAGLEECHYGLTCPLMLQRCQNISNEAYAIPHKQIKLQTLLEAISKG